jgi:uncharacterized protein YcfJ
MNKSAITGIVVGIAAATAIGAVAGYSALTDDETDANAENCSNVVVEKAAEPADDKRIAGTVIGAVVGGAVGNDVGDSDLTTAAGAAAGAYAANQAQKKYQENRTETTTEVRCGS